MRYQTLVTSCAALILLILGCKQEPLSPGNSPDSDQALGTARQGRNPHTGAPIYIPASKSVRGRLTLEADGVQIVYPGESADDPAPPKLALDGDGSTLEFTAFRSWGLADVDGTTAVVRTARCNVWISGAFPLLEEVQATSQVCTGTYWFSSLVSGDAPAPGSEELITTWSLSFDNGRINRVELVSDSDPNTLDYMELEIVADQWEFHHDTAVRQ